MLPSECPYPETNPEHPPSHPLGSSANDGHCAQCQRYYRRCPDCQAANRWLARFCRNCGHSLVPLNWLPEVAESPLHQLPLNWPQRFSPPVESGLTPMWAGLLDGRVFLLGTRGELRHLVRQPLRWEVPPGANTPPASAPSYLHGFLAIPGEDQITLIDLLDSRGGGRKVQRLRGPLLGPIASDNGQWLAALVMDGDNRGLQLFRLHQGRLQLAWNQVLEGARPDGHRFPRLLWVEDTLIYQSEDGFLSGLDPATGLERFHLQCPCPPGPLAPWVSNANAYWGGSDGSLWWLKTRPELQLHQISGGQQLPMLALAAGPRDLLASFGRMLLRVHLETSRSETLELPQYCTTSPWVGREDALVLSQEGQLYLLSLGTQTFQVESTEKMPSPYSSSLIPPFWNGREWLIFDSDGRLFVGE